MRAFTASDYSEYEGAEPFETGEEPMRGMTEFGATVILSRGMVGVYDEHSGDLIASPSLPWDNFSELRELAQGAEIAWSLRALINTGFTTYVEAGPKGMMV